jgi:hypothetical protein
MTGCYRGLPRTTKSSPICVFVRAAVIVCVQVIKFVGCYHGHADSFLVKAGSGVATLGLPDSPGQQLGLWFASMGLRGRGNKRPLQSQ